MTMLKTSKFSINRYLTTYTFIMACMHTIQVYDFGFENDESLLINPFNICKNSTLSRNSTFNGELNYVNSRPSLFIGIIWSAVIVSLLHQIFEAKFAARNEQVCFGTFLTVVWYSSLAHEENNEDLEMQDKNVEQEALNPDGENLKRQENIQLQTISKEVQRSQNI